MDYEAIHIMLDIHNKWLHGEEGGEQMELENADLSNMVLSKCNFSQAILRNVNLKGADLRRCNFLGAYIYDCDFTFADIREANFEQTDMRGNRFNGVNVGAETVSSKRSIDEMLIEEEAAIREDRKKISLSEEDFEAFESAYEEVTGIKSKR